MGCCISNSVNPLCTLFQRQTKSCKTLNHWKEKKLKCAVFRILWEHIQHGNAVLYLQASLHYIFFKQHSSWNKTFLKSSGGQQYILPLPQSSKWQIPSIHCIPIYVSVKLKVKFKNRISNHSDMLYSPSSQLYKTTMFWIQFLFPSSSDRRK
jgi:hypothetical protein